MKKFLIIPILIIAYIYFVNSMIQIAPQLMSSPTPGSGGGEALGFGETVGVSVERPYLFGLITLPVYTNAVGDISIYHEMFFYFIVIITIIFIIMEIRSRKKVRRKIKTKRKIIKKRKRR